MSAWKPEPPNDCRITLRCLKRTFDFRLPIERDFAELRSQNTLIDRFFSQRENDETGGQGGERIVQQTIRDWIDAGKLPCVRVGRRVRIKRSDFNRLIEQGYGGKKRDT
jgi:excisionase family DNA binding protein